MSRDVGHFGSSSTSPLVLILDIPTLKSCSWAPGAERLDGFVFGSRQKRGTGVDAKWRGRNRWFQTRTIWFLLLCLLVIVACQGDSPGVSSADSPDDGEVETANPSAPGLEVTIDSITAASLGPGFAAETGEIDGSSYVFLGAAAGLVIFDLADPGQLKEIGALLTPGPPQGLALLGNFLIAAGAGGISVVDVSDPSSPSQESFIPGTNEVRGLAFDRERNIAVVADFAGVRLFDTSATSQSGTLRELAALDFADATNAVAIDTQRQLALVTGDSGQSLAGGVVRVIDISDPTAPREIASTEITGRASGVAVDTARGLAVVAGAGGPEVEGSLHVIDISDPTSPKVIASIDTPGTAFSPDLDVDRKLVAVVGDGPQRGSGSMRLIDIAVPTRPIDVGGVELPSRALGVRIQEHGQALVAGGEGLVFIRYSSGSSR